MPDLDQIKQGEQERGTGAGGYRRADRARPRGRRGHPNRASDEGGGAGCGLLQIRCRCSKR
jgi:hypothetical protein